MRFWVLTLVLLAAKDGYAFKFTPNTQCVLCSTLIRCGPGVDAVIRPNNSGREITVERYCSEQSNERNPKYRELRNIFSKSRFTYAEYLQKVPTLKEKRIEVSPKPLIAASDLTNTSRTNDLQNYTNYVLDAIDPTQDADLEVKSDGTLVNKLDLQSQKVKDDLKSRAPSSVAKSNGAWVSPQQDKDRYIDPTEQKTTTPARRVAIPTATPVEFRTLINDSFRRSYCRGKTDRECNEIWNTVNKNKTIKADLQPLPKQEPKKSDRVVKPLPPNPTSANTNFSQPILNANGSPTLTNPTARMPSSTAASSFAATSASSTSNVSGSTLGATSKKNPSTVVPKVTIADTRASNLRPAAGFRSTGHEAVARMMAVNTSPVYRQVEVATPYGTLVNIKVQPSGDVFNPGRPICENLEDWRTTAFFTDALRNIDPSSKLLSESALNKDGFLSPTGFCQSSQSLDKVTCTFGSSQSACSCKDYSTQYFLERCRKMFTLEVVEPELEVSSCKEKLAAVIGNEKVIDKFARPYAASLAETYLCLNVPEINRQACNSKVDQTLAAMSEKECVGLHKALGPKAKEYVDQNKTELEKYDWFKHYQYHGKEFNDLFNNYDLGIKPKALRKGACNQQIRSILEDITKQLNEGHQEAVGDLNQMLFAQTELKKHMLDLCKANGCKQLFSEDVVRNFASKNKDRSINQKIAEEMKNLTIFYRDITVYDNLNNSYCSMQNPAPVRSPPIKDILNRQPQYQQSPAIP